MPWMSEILSGPCKWVCGPAYIQYKIISNINGLNMKGYCVSLQWWRPNNAHHLLLWWQPLRHVSVRWHSFGRDQFQKGLAGNREEQTGQSVVCRRCGEPKRKSVNHTLLKSMKVKSCYFLLGLFKANSKQLLTITVSRSSWTSTRPHDYHHWESTVRGGEGFFLRYVCQEDVGNLGGADRLIGSFRIRGSLNILPLTEMSMG